MSVCERCDEFVYQGLPHDCKSNIKEQGIRQHEGEKYLRTIHSAVEPDSIEVDVYSVLEAFGVTCPACQHAIKKLLAAGGRGKGSTMDDLVGALAAVSRAIELQKHREANCNGGNTGPSPETEPPRRA